MAQVQISKTLIEDIAESAGFIDPDAVYANYSGRGMYGQKCLGIVGGVSDLIAFTVEAVRRNEYNEADGNQSDEAQALAGFVRYIEDVSTDSMGLDTIFYWRDVKVSK